MNEIRKGIQEEINGLKIDKKQVYLATVELQKYLTKNFKAAKDVVSGRITRFAIEVQTVGGDGAAELEDVLRASIEFERATGIQTMLNAEEALARLESMKKEDDLFWRAMHPYAEMPELFIEAINDLNKSDLISDDQMQKIFEIINESVKGSK